MRRAHGDRGAGRDRRLIARAGESHKAHPGDGRKFLLHLTQAGRDRLAEERRRRADWLGAAINTVLDADERRTLEAALPLLSRLSAHLHGT
ncbi:hypothetical protein GCM10010287_27090 [Streptomyces variabilis]|uniref:MarR family transcriptional regulator n=1 Tax=Streptomyces variabilis TaxID=67372 RepID=A0ABQ2U1B6_9ACTN|nr:MULTISPECIES: hypothetical protein [Streptomyces]MDH3034337.1 hypothetical protein [Streptomyces sp. TRM75561]GGP63297.1 hypothetical protein GCM10010265_46730 [Streptomyces griseoincarnatus]GGT51652.1 hypothetical protein GCM10010287_27090 [Streptomyces variabilis]